MVRSSCRNVLLRSSCLTSSPRASPSACVSAKPPSTSLLLLVPSRPRSCLCAPSITGDIRGRLHARSQHTKNPLLNAHPAGSHTENETTGLNRCGSAGPLSPGSISPAHLVSSSTARHANSRSVWLEFRPGRAPVCHTETLLTRLKQLNSCARF